MAKKLLNGFKIKEKINNDIINRVNKSHKLIRKKINRALLDLSHFHDLCRAL